MATRTKTTRRSKSKSKSKVKSFKSESARRFTNKDAQEVRDFLKNKNYKARKYTNLVTIKTTSTKKAIALKEKLKRNYNLGSYIEDKKVVIYAFGY